MSVDVLVDLNVSRETIVRLQDYDALVQKWTRSINLISHKDAADLWTRHILDSAQIYHAAPRSGDWLDIGSGGGFPGLVISILDREFLPERKMTLVDSDQRKCAFLRTVVRELGLNAAVVAGRVEELDPQEATILSARALGPLDSLLAYASRHLRAGGVALFPKGKNWREEDETARKTWSYGMETFKSMTNPEAIILKIKEVARV